MDIVPFQAHHLEMFTLQDAQRQSDLLLNPEVYGAPLEAFPSFSGLAGGECIGCAGVLPLWPGLGVAWALLSPDAGRHFVQITRAAKRFFAVAPFRRIEASAEVQFPAARRWLELLGFTQYAPEPQKGYSPSGNDVWLYARVN